MIKKYLILLLLFLMTVTASGITYITDDSAIKEDYPTLNYCSQTAMDISRGSSYPYHEVGIMIKFPSEAYSYNKTLYVYAVSGSPHQLRIDYYNSVPDECSITWDNRGSYTYINYQIYMYLGWNNYTIPANISGVYINPGAQINVGLTVNSSESAANQPYIIYTTPVPTPTPTPTPPPSYTPKEYSTNFSDIDFYDIGGYIRVAFNSLSYYVYSTFEFLNSLMYSIFSIPLGVLSSLLNGLILITTDLMGVFTDISGLMSNVYNFINFTVGLLYDNSWIIIITLGFSIVVALRIYGLVRGSKT